MSFFGAALFCARPAKRTAQPATEIPLPSSPGDSPSSICVPAQPDDLGTGDDSERGTQGKTSKSTGNAGARLACGVIGFAA